MIKMTDVWYHVDKCFNPPAQCHIDQGELRLVRPSALSPNYTSGLPSSLTGAHQNYNVHADPTTRKFLDDNMLKGATSSQAAWTAEAVPSWHNPAIFTCASGEDGVLFSGRGWGNVYPRGNTFIPAQTSSLRSLPRVDQFFEAAAQQSGGGSSTSARSRGVDSTSTNRRQGADDEQGGSHNTCYLVDNDSESCAPAADVEGNGDRFRPFFSSCGRDRIRLLHRTVPDLWPERRVFFSPERFFRDVGDAESRPARPVLHMLME
ncbi:unnamed protein product [Amoebophrya sp. A25]|nr:unnamed protein product [Amoebophrya sp. A25]|eukprot:GSA25T00006184001.1